MSSAAALAIARLRAGKIFTMLPQTETEQRLRSIAESLGQSFWSCNAETGELLSRTRNSNGCSAQRRVPLQPPRSNSSNSSTPKTASAWPRRSMSGPASPNARSNSAWCARTAARAGCGRACSRCSSTGTCHGSPASPRTYPIARPTKPRVRESQRKMSALIDALPASFFACTNDRECTSSRTSAKASIRRPAIGARNCSATAARSSGAWCITATNRAFMSASRRLCTPPAVCRRIPHPHQRRARALALGKGQGIYDARRQAPRTRGPFITDVTERQTHRGPVGTSRRISCGARWPHKRLDRGESGVRHLQGDHHPRLCDRRRRVYLCENVSTDEPGRLKLLRGWNDPVTDRAFDQPETSWPTGPTPPQGWRAGNANSPPATCLRRAGKFPARRARVARHG